MARSLLILWSSFITRGRPCSASRQKQQQACLFRPRRHDPRSPIHRRETIVSRRWSTAARPRTLMTIGQAQRHSSHPPHSAARTMRRPPPTPNDRATPGLPIRRAERIPTIATPPPGSAPTPTPTPTQTRLSSPAPGPAPSRLAPRSQSKRNRPIQAGLPRLLLHLIFHLHPILRPLPTCRSNPQRP